MLDYALTVTASEVGKPVSIVHSSSDPIQHSSYDPSLELYAPDGSLLQSRSGNYYYDALEIDDFVLPVAGTYTIRVFEGGNDATGNFTIGVSDQPITPAPNRSRPTMNSLAARFFLSAMLTNSRSMRLRGEVFNVNVDALNARSRSRPKHRGFAGCDQGACHVRRRCRS